MSALLSEQLSLSREVKARVGGLFVWLTEGISSMGMVWA